MEEEKRRGRNIPQEIIQEILVNLPVKSLVRFKAVSREWRGKIESKYFIYKHMEFQKSQREQARLVAFSIETRYNGLTLANHLFSANGVVRGSPYQPIRSFNRFDSFKISEPCDGLFCLYTITRIFNLVNPATTSRRRLPNPTSTFAQGAYRDFTLLGIGRENSASPKYKLLWFFDIDNYRVIKSTRCKVFGLDSNTWRYVKPPNCRVYYEHPLIHLDGVIYCFSYYMKTTQHIEQDIKLLAFDLHTETFQRFSITPDLGFSYCHELTMRVLNNRLCIFKRLAGENDIVFKIWGLDINKRSWEVMYTIDLTCIPTEFKKGGFTPMATINNHLIISNSYRNMVLIYGSKNRILCRTSVHFYYFMSFFESLLSVHQ